MLSTDIQSDAEKQAREELAACYRLAAKYNFTDLIYTHITARVPGSDNHFLINPYGLQWGEITASSLVKIDVDGNIVGESAHGVNPAGFTIHSAIHMNREDAHWVMHTHTRAGVAVSCMEEGLLPLNQISLQFYDRVAYHDFEGIALDLEERQRIVADLGDKPVLVLRNHGLVAMGRSAAEMFNNMFYLERACEIQVAALSMGGATPRLIDDKIGRHVVAQYAQGAEEGELDLEWQAHLRSIAGVGTDYRS
ncbi:class II aldolase/adducin family protein [Pseudooceanicola sp. CBS1P-1]|uniref:Class II aldolase/adducin family protein n=1 Tax=Pseudooceanicola albus TaxID=2692189 RepID=A0A6L7G8B7_9RHOB|nr:MULTISPECIES: class II aldolase/adducin family protein [Pseudooceanicola]MBT9385999.1 class II aldolase/adducin family protein [Pseudooceanicola endophyticus]MXN19580.1 class II aldolase/adducin family protein [Pseudooceanicola albus]